MKRNTHVLLLLITAMKSLYEDGGEVGDDGSSRSRFSAIGPLVSVDFDLMGPSMVEFLGVSFSLSLSLWSESE